MYMYVCSTCSLHDVICVFLLIEGADEAHPLPASSSAPLSRVTDVEDHVINNVAKLRLAVYMVHVCSN